jgi:hypothetical protein
MPSSPPRSHRRRLGLGADLAKIEAVCGEDPDALVMLRKAIVQPVGRPVGKRGITDIVSNNDGHGNARSYTLARLQQHRPDLYQRVKAGELTANAAAIEAGFRKPPEPLRQFSNLWAKMIPEERDAFEDFIADWRRFRLGLGVRLSCGGGVRIRPVSDRCTAVETICAGQPGRVFVTPVRIT